MGETCIFTPDTVFPSHRRLRLPKGGPKSEIVRYADFVQMHSCCQYLAGLSHPPTIVDVGAHHGAYAIVLGKIAKRNGGRLIAIEPNPQSFAVLTENVRMNDLADTVIAEQLAITRTSSTVQLVLSGSQSYCADEDAYHETVPVNGEPLSAVLERHSVKHVDLLIVDVEGAELPALSSFPWSESTVGRVFCELHPNEWTHFGYTPAEFSAFLRERDFRCIDMYFQEYDEIRSASHIGPCCFLPGRERSKTASQHPGPEA
jgi:FkbM family methyltransferase